MKIKAIIQNVESQNIDSLVPYSSEAMDVEDLMEKIIEAKEQAEEEGFSFSDELEVVEEGNNSLTVVSHGVGSDEKMILKISNFKNRIDQDSVRDYLSASN